MLDAISDFWKPMKKSQVQEKLHPEQLQVGSAIGFGFVPQAYLSGRRLEVVAINTYQFGAETLTSFVLSSEKDAGGMGISMIVATADDEQYLGISRRLTISERMKLFESQDLEDIMEKEEVKQLACKSGIPDFKGWTVGTYKREMQGVKGRLFKGDFRKASLPASGGQEFKYTLLASDNNEYAIEVEKYTDGRVEVYATVYRRTSDIGDVSYSSSKSDAPAAPAGRPDIKLASPGEARAPAAASPGAAIAMRQDNRTESKPEAPKVETPKVEAPKPASVVTAAKSEPIALPELSKAPEQPKAEAPKPQAQSPQQPPKMEAKPAAPVVAAPVVAAKPVINPPVQEEKKMPFEPAMNGRAEKSPVTMTGNTTPKTSSVVVQPNAPASYLKQEIKTVSKTMNGADADAIECDLRVANRIIDEAIRNEMRLSDIVRRIIELPVAYPESVQIPITLSDEDFSLLAIRYGISSSDRGAIKQRIIEDLNDFSGGNAGAKKAA